MKAPVSSAATRRTILYGSDRPAGYMTIARFLDHLEAETLAGSDALAAIADSLAQILEKGAEPAEALKLKRQRGEKRAVSAQAIDQKYGKIAAYVLKSIQDDPVKRGAVGRATVAAALKFNKSEREIQKGWRLQRHLLLALQKFSRQQQVIRDQLTPIERKNWATRSGVAHFRLARRRSRAAHR